MELWPHVELGHSQYTHTPNETNESKTLEIILWSLRHHSIVVGASNSTWRIFSNLCLCLGELLLLTLDKSPTWAATRIHRAEIYGSSGDLQSIAHVTTLEDSHLKLYTWSQQIHHGQEFAAWGYTTNGCTVKIPSTNPKAQSGSHTEIEILNWDYFFHMKPHETTVFFPFWNMNYLNLNPNKCWISLSIHTLDPWVNVQYFLHFHAFLVLTVNSCASQFLPTPPRIAGSTPVNFVDFRDKVRDRGTMLSYWQVGLHPFFRQSSKAK